MLVEDERGAPDLQDVEGALDAEGLRDRAVGVAQQREVDAVLVGELRLLVDRSIEIPTRTASAASNSVARSRKWQLSLVHPDVIAAG